MEFARLRECEDLFGSRWDALALICLAEHPHPHGFNQLARAMRATADEHLFDNVVNRSLKHLLRDRLVAKYGGQRDRHPTYALTPIGTHQATRVARYLGYIEKGRNGPTGDDLPERLEDS